MKNNKANFVLIGMTVLSALVAVVLVYIYINARVTSARQEMETKYATLTDQLDMADVVVCAEDIPAGTVILPEDLEVRKINLESLGDADFISDPALVINRKIQQNMYKGEWIVKERLRHVTPTGVSKIIMAKGNRAIRLWLNPTSGLLGLIKPGSMIDVMAVLPASKGGQKAGKIVLQNIRILAVANRLDYHSAVEEKTENKDAKVEGGPSKAMPKATTVTLEVTPEQALDLTLAMEVGKLHLALRNPDDQEIVVSSPALQQSTLLTKGKKAARRAVKRKKKKTKKDTVTIISGDSVNTEVINK